jgi:Tol biopolymer transport system component
MLSFCLAGLLAAIPLRAAGIDLVSRIDPSLISDTGSGAVFTPVPFGSAISADGRYIAFASIANNLVPGQQDRNQQNDVFLYDRDAATVALVSHVPSSPTVTSFGASSDPVISADGRWVAYLNRGTDIVSTFGTTFDHPSVYLYDRTTGANLAVFRDSSSLPSFTYVEDLSISADGRYVVFDTDRPSVIPGETDTNQALDAFLYDRVAGTLVRIAHSVSSPTHAANGGSYRARISADGRWVTFISPATDLIAGQVDHDLPKDEDLFLWDRTTGQLSLVSHAPGSPLTAAGNNIQTPEISGDGRYVTFVCDSSSLVAGQIDSGLTDDVFVFDRTTGTVSLVSHEAGAAGTAVAGASDEPSISADGGRIAFSSTGSSLVAGVTGMTDPNGQGKDVFVYEVATGAITLVSHSTAGATTTGDYPSASPRISADGTTVAFASRARDLVAGQGETGADTDWDLFRSDLGSGAVAQISHVPAGGSGDAPSERPAIDTDGGFVSFSSLASDLISGVRDGNFGYDLFLYGRSADASTLLTRRAGASPSLVLAADSTLPKVPARVASADGRYVAFATAAPVVMSSVVDTNGKLDLYLRDRTAGTTFLITHAAGSAITTANVGMFDPYDVQLAISADGRRVAYTSRATNLVAGQIDGNIDDRDVFLWDRDTGTTTLVSHDSGSAAATGMLGSWGPSISADGRYVAFVSRAENLVAGETGNGEPNAFLFDQNTGTVTLVSHATGSATTAAASVSEVTVSADGGTAAYVSLDQNLGLYLWDRSSGAITFVTHASGSPSAPAHGYMGAFSLSDDGSRVAYLNDAADLVAGQVDNNSDSDVFLFDRASGNNVLVSRSAASPSQAGNFLSDGVAMSGDGRWVAFTSLAYDLVPGQLHPNGGRQVYLYQVANGSTILVSHRATSAVTGGEWEASDLAINGDGRYVAYADLSTSLLLDPVTPGWDRAYLYDRLLGGSRLLTPLPVYPSAPPSGVRQKATDSLVGIQPRAYDLSLSADGTTVVMTALDPLAPGDFNGARDVYAFTQTLPQGSFYTVMSCRLLDTRQPGQGPAFGSETRRLIVAGRCGVPATARAIAVNATIVNPTAAGRMTLHAGDLAAPAASMLSFGAGQTRAGSAIVPLAWDETGTLGVTPFLPGGSADVTVDVVGYFD